VRATTPWLWAILSFSITQPWAATVSWIPASTRILWACAVGYDPSSSWLDCVHSAFCTKPALLFPWNMTSHSGGEWRHANFKIVNGSHVCDLKNKEWEIHVTCSEQSTADKTITGQQLWMDKFRVHIFMARCFYIIDGSPSDCASSLLRVNKKELEHLLWKQFTLTLSGCNIFLTYWKVVWLLLSYFHVNSFLLLLINIEAY
jgi:hypothetical protein